jgi:hypothetical protein
MGDGDSSLTTSAGGKPSDPESHGCLDLYGRRRRQAFPRQLKG